MHHLDTFERVITRTLLVLMSGVILLATVELAYLLGKDVLTPPMFLLDLDELLELFGQFLLVLIGVELLHTMKTYIAERVIHLEEVLIVAMIAIARKIVVLNANNAPDGSLMGIAAIVFALTLGYYLVRRSRWENGDASQKGKR